MPALALIMIGFGLFLLLTAIVVQSGHRRTRQELRSLRRQVARARHVVKPADEKARRRAAIEEIEARKRVIHGWFDSGGC